MKKNNYPGKFIVVEGLDGSGQSTQVDLLTNFFKKRKIPVLKTKEPTPDSKAGKKIRKVLDKNQSTSPKKLQKLFAEDRKDHLEKEIIPALKKGQVVVSDRYFFSSFAFGTSSSVPLDWIIKINKNFLMPDLTFFLNVSPRVCIRRIDERGIERTLFEEEKKQEKVIKIYRTFPNKFKNFELINGEKSIKKVFSDIKEVVLLKLNLNQIRESK